MVERAAEIVLRPEVAVGDEATEELPWGGEVVRNVVRPTLTPVLPAPGTESGTAVLVCPGGAFHFVSMESEGFAVARWLAERGHAAYVLKYRVAPTPLDAEGFGEAVMAAFTSPGGLWRWAPPATDDGELALAVVRERAERVVPLGFSAGGRLVADLLRRGAAVDAAGIVYLPTFEGDVEPAAPLFLLAASDDPLGVDGSLDLYRRWRDADRPAELHLYQHGGHGFGMNRLGLPVDGWIDRFHDWLVSTLPAGGD